jgi:hypothetical protein
MKLSQKLSVTLGTAALTLLQWQAISAPSLSQTKPKRQQTSTSTIPAKYTKLRDLLAAERWKEADEETRGLILAAAKREEQGWLDKESIGKLPCEDLRTIDQLWVKSSNGRFGFSVQKRVYQSVGGTREFNKGIWNKFEQEVGWINGNNNYLQRWEITFDKSAPQGHLPWVSSAVATSAGDFSVGVWVLDTWSGGRGVVSFPKLVKCNI